ncbi:MULTISPECIES: MOSC domain-containing protein [Rhodococcus]|uniref:MOSC domain-containing protein n=1 Tax=Rhodococcus TaxID=1827 RepID=UPI0013EB3D06|nr:MULTISPECIES: MOSC domain-containing protein [Rhodococcus]UTT50584.1 MOSC domain-containing protein [Rhodococcus gordoniae]
MRPATSGTVAAACIVHTLHETGLRRNPVTAIDKRPVDGPVHVGELGLAGDRQCDTANHGGRFKAVYAFSQAESRRWGTELDRELPIGWFGENLHVAGFSPTDAVIGERWRVGEGGLLLEVTGPRTPCRTFAIRSHEGDWATRFTARGDCGAYLKVIVEGPVGAGDRIVVEHVPSHGATVRDLFTGRGHERVAAMLEQQSGLAPSVVAKARRLAGRPQKGSVGRSRKGEAR